ncbi:hypothetical protein niasHT_003535 [Heterodera trifolii]|uniref:Uncharacterized protein n=1 Tax=Heterodera trifolii TaxID=157864 RepID=A0ABD2M2P9_9BILA
MFVPMAQKFEKELKIVQKHFGDECRKRESAERSLAENRAVLEKLNTTIIETNAELNQARQKIGEMEQEQDKLKKWENKCKEMKQERVRIQANAMELKKRTDEAVQELGKMSRTHQQKEIGWMREKKHLEEQLRELTKPTTGGKKVSESSSQSSTTTTESNKRTTTERVEELEQEKKCLEAKMEELRKIREQEMAAHQTEKIEWQREREQMGGRAHKMNGATSLCQAVDYKQIADNALRAAEELQKQYREYQRHYTAEVQRLSGQLVKLEQELATRQQQITVVAPTETVADQKQDENNKDNDAVNVSAVIKMPTQHQAQHVTRPHRGYESPSMSSLTENNFTDNTTWDSRLLDCGSMMTRSISPLKGQSAMFRGGSTVPMLQCRAVDIHPSSPLAGLGQRAIGVMDDGDFGSVDDVQQKYRRTGSAGTNILYRIRREELAQGKHPTVRQMARAFESFEKLQQKGNSSEEPKRKRIKPTKGGLFGLLGKSSSMEVSSMSEKNLKTPKAFRKGEHVPSEKMPGSNEKNPRRRRQSFAVSVVVSSARGAQSVQGNNRDGGQSRDGTPSQNTIGITSEEEEEAVEKYCWYTKTIEQIKAVYLYELIYKHFLAELENNATDNSFNDSPRALFLRDWLLAILDNLKGFHAKTENGILETLEQKRRQFEKKLEEIEKRRAEKAEKRMNEFTEYLAELEEENEQKKRKEEEKKKKKEEREKKRKKKKGTKRKKERKKEKQKPSKN